MHPLLLQFHDKTLPLNHKKSPAGSSMCPSDPFSWFFTCAQSPPSLWPLFCFPSTWKKWIIPESTEVQFSYVTKICLLIFFSLPPLDPVFIIVKCSKLSRGSGARWKMVFNSEFLEWNISTCCSRWLNNSARHGNTQQDIAWSNTIQTKFKERPYVIQKMNFICIWAFGHVSVNSKYTYFIGGRESDGNK